MKKLKKLQDVGEYGTEDRDKVAGHLFETIATAAGFYRRGKDKWGFGISKNESIVEGTRVLPDLCEMVWKWHVEFEEYLMSSEHLLENAYRLADKEGITGEEAVKKLLEPSKTTQSGDSGATRGLPSGWPLDYS